jgi:8-oxo-dGTP pyrophosphatase MutT (NUDIX family)
MSDFIPLSNLPRVLVVDPPSPSREDLRQINLEHNKLLARRPPLNYDAPTMVCLRASEEEVLLYQAPYSWQKVVKKRSPSSLGEGPASVRLIIGDGEGDYLWAQRSLRLRSKPGRWSWACAGGIDEPGEDASVAVRREASEELGIDPNILTNLRLVGALPKSGYCTVWSATIPRKTHLSLAPSEVADVCWASDPLTLYPLSNNVKRFWPQINPLLT